MDHCRHEDHSSSSTDKAFLQADVLCFMGYGMDVALFILAFSLLRARSKMEKRKTGQRHWQTSILEVYNCLVFILCTLSAASKIQMMMTAYIDNKNAEGGQGCYQMNLYTSVAIGILGNISCAVVNWLVDGLLLWRCYVIYRNSKTSPWLVLCIPAILGLALIVISILFLHAISKYKDSPFRDSPFRDSHLTLLVGSACLVLNVVLTFMIVMRLFLYRRSIKRLAGAKYAGQYTSIVSMLIESGSIMDVAVISIVILMSLNSPMVALPLLSVTEVQAIAAFMIIIRVAKGTAWSSETANELIAQHAIDRRMNSTEIVTGVSPFRITTQMTQMSAGFHFNHAHSTVATTPGGFTRTSADNTGQGDKLSRVNYENYLSEGPENMRAKTCHGAAHHQDDSDDVVEVCMA
ncbi:hypothetical protein D9613_009640 [Agrocybe pediades]|uniref:Uncharacterized protein n=1 Tax=Agrocybe pediades TaxID=84607 RepID=A0A8H4R4T9_9AGAR|nr:hypothetical protein D9613_009640 [Agrocybe pediades]